MNLAASEAGFQNWEHARIVLGGEAKTGEDMGDFWHGTEVSVFINHWYASYAEAQEQLRVNEAGYLLPYRKPYLVVTSDYLQALGVSAAPEIWNYNGRDLVQGYGSASWLNLAQQRLQSSRTERFKANWDASQTMLDLQSTEVEAERVMKSFVKDGRLVSIPEQRKKRLVILRWLVEQLQFERLYVEADINSFLLQFHSDFATLRRRFIMGGVIGWAVGGGRVVVGGEWSRAGGGWSAQAPDGADRCNRAVQELGSAGRPAGSVLGPHRHHGGGARRPRPGRRHQGSPPCPTAER